MNLMYEHLKGILDAEEREWFIDFLETFDPKSVEWRVSIALSDEVRHLRRRLQEKVDNVVTVTIKQLEKENTKLRERVGELEGAFKHPHDARGEHSDWCAQCRMNIRDSIHVKVKDD